MCNMGLIGLTGLFETAAISSVAGSLLTVIGTPGLIKVSQIFSDREGECQEGSTAKLAYKIAKWAVLALAAIVGTLGALSVGIGVGLLTVSSFGYPIPLITAIVTAALLEVQVVKKVWQQASLYNQPALPKAL